MIVVGIMTKGVSVAGPFYYLRNVSDKCHRDDDGVNGFDTWYDKQPK